MYFKGIVNIMLANTLARRLWFPVINWHVYISRIGIFWMGLLPIL